MSSEIFYACKNVLPPHVFYHYDFAKPLIENENPKKLRERKLKGFDETKFEFEELHYSVEDFEEELGVKLPITIIKKKNMIGPKRCLMFGYGLYCNYYYLFLVYFREKCSILFLCLQQGGYGVPNIERIDESTAYFLNEFDGFIAFPTVRGEGGHPALHNLGRNSNKQNAFSDFQAAAKHLIKLKYTKPKLIAIHGASHGGLLVTVCLNQAPGNNVLKIPDIFIKVRAYFYHQNYLALPSVKLELWIC